MTEMVLNCGSSEEELGRWMSNLTPAEFILGNVKWASVEALYIALRTLDEAERMELSQLSGLPAKHRGRKLRKRGLVTTQFDGRCFELGSAQHHELVKEAIKAKLLAHPEKCAEFVATRPRTIVHETGFPESRFTQLPAVVFCRILTELREELHQLVS